MRSDDWMEVVDAARTRLRDLRRLSASAAGIKPNAWTAVLTWRDHGSELELEFPGCSVMWDQHPELRTWERYQLGVVENYVARKPYSYRGMPDTMIGHQKHRRQRLEMLAAARELGVFMLVAYPLQPPTWKPAMIAVEQSYPAPSYEWQPRGTMYRANEFKPIRAVYTPVEQRWTVVR